MSLIKLLSIGKTVMAGNNQRGRYRMAGQGLLPKFAPVGRLVSLAPNPNRGEAPAGGPTSKQGRPEACGFQDVEAQGTLTMQQSCERHSPYAQPNPGAGAAVAGDP